MPFTALAVMDVDIVAHSPVIARAVIAVLAVASVALAIEAMLWLLEFLEGWRKRRRARAKRRR